MSQPLSTRSTLSSLWIFVLIAALFTASCSSSTPIAIALASSAGASLAAGQSTTITATVTHDSGNKGVTWTLSPSTGAGTLSGSTTTSVTYTAPATVASATTVTITATSVANTAKSVTFTINLLPVSIALAPAGPQTLEQSQNTTPSPITATVSNDPANKGVTWTLTGAGAISGQTATTVVYKAPASITVASTATVIATSVSDTTKTQSLTINLVPPPSVTTTSLPNGIVGVTYPTATLAAANGVSPYTWSVTVGTLPAGLSLTASTGAITGTPTAYGTSNFTVQVKDADNFTATAALSIKISPAPLTITTTSPLPNAVINTAYSTTLTSGGGATPITCAVTAGALPTGLLLNTVTGAITGAPTVSGTFNFTVTATDSSTPAMTATKALTLNVDQAPAITSGGSVTFTVGTAGTFTVTTTGFPAPALSESGALPSGVTFTDNGNGTGKLSGTPAAGTGKAYSITFTASNGVGSNATQNFTLTVDQAPAITSANSASFALGGLGNFTVTTTGFPAPALTESGALPSGVTFTDNGNGTGKLSGTPAAGTNGTYPITFTATNGVGTPSSQPFTLTVNTAPVITSANSTTFTVGTAGSFTVTATGTPTPTLSETGTLPTGVTFTAATGVLSGTPAAGTGGTYPIVFTASNGVGSNATQNFTLTVDQAPVITSANSTTFTEGTFASFTVMTTGFPAPSLVEAGALPSGVTFTDNLNGTGTLKGTPASGTAAMYPLTFTASNSVGTPATQSFTLTVNTAPVITSATSTTFTVGTPGTFTVMATGTPTPTLSETGTLPTGVTFTPATGVLSGTPGAGTGGTYPIMFKATSTSGNTTQNFTLTVDQAPAITSANSATFTVGTAGTFTVTATGTPTPTLSETGALPTGVTFNTTTGVLSGTPAAGTAGSYPLVFTATNGIGTPAAQNFTLTVSAAATCTSGGSESLLSGGYAFVLKGFDSSGNPALVGGVLTFNGTGGITAGAIDMNLNSGVQTNLSVTSASSSYHVTSDHRGCMVITTSAGTQNYRFSLGNIISSVASTGHVIGFDSAGPFAAGIMRKQSGGPFSNASANGSYAFGGSSPQNAAQGGGKFGLVGVITFNGSGGITGGSEDINQNGTLDGTSTTSWPTNPISINSATSSYNIAANGRGTEAIGVVSTAVLFNSVIYVVSSSEALFMTSDSQTLANHNISAGQALKQSGTLSGNPLSGAYIGYQSGLNTTGTTPVSRTTLLLITASGTGVSGTQLRNDGGSFQSNSIGTGITYSVASSGRMTVSGGGGTGPIFYLVSPNQLFILNGNSTVESGFFQSQTGTSASGTYAFGVIDPQDASVGTESGVATFTSATTSISGISDNNSSGSQNLGSPFGPQSYSIDSTGLVSTPSGCTISATSTTCQTLIYVISPTKAVVMDIGSTNNTNTRIEVADQ